MTYPYAQRIQQLQEINAPVLAYLTRSSYPELVDKPGVCDFALGNPQEMPLPGFSEALQKHITPQNKNWFAYKDSEPKAQAAAAAALRERRGVPFQNKDIMMTNGAFTGLAITLTAAIDPGDEVIFISPPWFFYESQITAAGGQPVRVKCDPDTFDLDVNAIREAVTPRTRAVIVNSPNNPTGKIYPESTLQELGSLLSEAGEDRQRPIALISDEAYCRIVYEGREYPSPTEFYPHSFLVYTYGKTLLTPGQRLGYVALPPDMPDRGHWRQALFTAQLMTGYAFPNALLQHALQDLEQLSIDVAHLQEKRDRLVRALRDMGYQLHIPEGTFYLLVRSPLDDDRAFVERLAEKDILCLPGSVAECPGYFRISLTASDEMIERALPGFADALQESAGQ